jgi:DNA-binding NarL/FixJ family response regulator
MVRLLIVDDHVLVRQALLQLLQRDPRARDIEIVGETSSERGAFSLVRELHPHVALIDLNMPDSNGLEATRAIRQTSPDAQIVLRTANGNPELLQSIIAAGVVGYLTNDTNADSLIAAIHAGHEGKTMIGLDVAS